MNATGLSAIIIHALTPLNWLHRHQFEKAEVGLYLLKADQDRGTLALLVAD